MAETKGKPIETRDLTVYYGKHRGIINVNLEVDRGEVFGFLGPNGAGKTTTQRVLLDVIRPNRGRATVFGLDCRKEGDEVRRKIGYLPGELSLYKNMTGAGFLDLIGSIQHHDAENGYRTELVERLELDTSRKIREYSRGNKQKIGVVAAFMGKPDLLILDEPTSGLDPLVQQTVLDLVRQVRDEGRTVFFSSHILQEVEAVCDRVGIIRQGRLIKTERVETLTKQQFRRINLTLKTQPPTDAFTFQGVSETGRDGQTIMFEVREGLDELIKTALAFGILDIETVPVTLEEIFLAFYGRNGGDHA